jgi:hypothetical protein
MKAEPNNQSHQSITFIEGMTLALNAGKSVDSHWTQFYAYLFALLAWLSSKSGPTGNNEAVIISIATCSFFALNGLATIRSYLLLDLIADETIHAAKHTMFLSKKAANTILSPHNRMRLPLRIPITALAHAAGAACIVYLTWKSI